MLGSGEARKDNSAQIPHYRVRPLVLVAKQSDRGINNELQDKVDVMFPGCVTCAVCSKLSQY